MAKKYNTTVTVKDNGDLIVRDAHIIWRNFEGRPETYEPRGGKRNFTWVIDDPEMAEELASMGFNVKSYQSAKHPESEPMTFIKISVRFDTVPPKIKMVANGNTTSLDEDAVACLDTAELDKFSMVIHPYHWNMQGREGITAYLSSARAVIAVDPLEEDDYETDGDDEVEF